MRRFLASCLAFVAAVSLVLIATGCGSGGTTDGGGSITLSLSPASASIPQGGLATVTGTIGRTNFTGDVAINVSGAPTGVTGAVTVAPINGSITAQVTLSAATSTATGTYPITVTASGTGISSVTATFTLTITAAPSSFLFTLTPTNTSLAQGGSFQLTGNVIRNNFPGDIAVAVTTVPAGVTGNVTMAPVSGGNTALITISASSTAAPGSFPLTVTATSGLITATATMNLTITVTGSFTIAAGSASVSVIQGSATTTSINATRAGGFAGTPVFTVTGPGGAALPAGLTAAVTPTGTADQNTLTVTTTAGLAVGTYPLVVHATAFGSEQTANVSVAVTPIGLAVRLDYSQCAAASKPVWVGFQDGSAAFAHSTGTGDVYTFNITASKGALATVVPSGIGFVTTVQYYSQAEFAAFTGGCAAVVPAGKTITGSTTGISGADNPEIAMGGANTFTNVATPNFTLNNVPSGILDLISYKRVQLNPSINDLVLIHRDQNIPNGGSTGALNFATDGVPVATSTINVTGGATTYFATMNYLTGAACVSNQLDFNTNAIATPFTAFGVSAAQQRPTDFHNLVLQHILGQTDDRTVSTSFHTLGNMVVAIGAGIGPFNVTMPTGAYRLVTATFTLAPDYNNVSLAYGANGSVNRFIINQSTAWLAGSTAITLAATDLSTVAGYQATWGPSTAGAVAYTITATSTPITNMCVEGATYRTATAGAGGA